MSDNASNSSDSDEAMENHPSTTTISTVAVQAGGARIVLAILKCGTWIKVQIQQMVPDLYEIGSCLVDTEKLKRVHEQLIIKLSAKQTQISELLSKADELVSQKPTDQCEVYAAMASSLGRGWRDLQMVLKHRGQLLDIASLFFQSMIDLERGLTNTEQWSSQFNVSGEDRNPQVLSKLDNVKQNLLNLNQLCLTRGKDILTLISRLGSLTMAEGSSETASETCQFVEERMLRLHEHYKHLEELFSDRTKRMDKVRHFTVLENTLLRLVNWFYKIGEPRLNDICVGRSLSETKENLSELMSTTENARDINDSLHRLIKSVANMIDCSHKHGHLGSEFAQSTLMNPDCHSAMMKDELELTDNEIAGAAIHMDDTEKREFVERLATADTHSKDFMERAEEKRRALTQAVVFYCEVELLLQRLKLLDSEIQPSVSFTQEQIQEFISHLADIESRLPTMREVALSITSGEHSSVCEESGKLSVTSHMTEVEELYQRILNKSSLISNRKQAFNDQITEISNWLLESIMSELRLNNSPGVTTITVSEFLESHKNVLLQLKSREEEIRKMKAEYSQRTNSPEDSQYYMNRLSEIETLWTRCFTLVSTRVDMFTIFLELLRMVHDDETELQVFLDDLLQINMDSITSHQVDELDRSFARIRVRLEKQQDVLSNVESKLTKMEDEFLKRMPPIEFCETQRRANSERLKELEIQWATIGQNTELQRKFKSQLSLFFSGANNVGQLMDQYDGKFTSGILMSPTLDCNRLLQEHSEAREVILPMYHKTVSLGNDLTGPVWADVACYYDNETNEVRIVLRRIQDRYENWERTWNSFKIEINSRFKTLRWLSTIEEVENEVSATRVKLNLVGRALDDDEQPELVDQSLLNIESDMPKLETRVKSALDYGRLALLPQSRLDALDSNFNLLREDVERHRSSLLLHLRFRHSADEVETYMSTLNIYLGKMDERMRSAKRPSEAREIVEDLMDQTNRGKQLAEREIPKLTELAHKIYGPKAEEKVQPLVFRFHNSQNQLKKMTTDAQTSFDEKLQKDSAPQREAPRITRPLADKIIDEGDFVRLDCAWRSGLPPGQEHKDPLIVEWLKDDKPIVPTHNMKVETYPQGGSIVIPEVFDEDAGKYKCRISNSAGYDETANYLRVNPSKHAIKPPRFTKNLVSKEIPEDDFLELECQVVGDEPMEVMWFKNNHPLKAENPNFETMKKDGKCSLKCAEPAKPQDQNDLYECRAVNPAGEATTAGEISVKPGEPPIIVHALHDATCPINSDLQLLVKYVSSAPFSVTWFKNDKPLNEAKENILHPESGSTVLALPGASPLDAGTYSCQVANRYGEASTICQLDMIDVHEEMIHVDSDEEMMTPKKKPLVESAPVPDEPIIPKKKGDVERGRSPVDSEDMKPTKRGEVERPRSQTPSKKTDRHLHQESRIATSETKEIHHHYHHHYESVVKTKLHDSRKEIFTQTEKAGNYKTTLDTRMSDSRQNFISHATHNQAMDITPVVPLSHYRTELDADIGAQIDVRPGFISEAKHVPKEMHVVPMVQQDNYRTALDAEVNKEIKLRSAYASHYQHSHPMQVTPMVPQTFVTDINMDLKEQEKFSSHITKHVPPKYDPVDVAFKLPAHPPRFSRPIRYEEVNVGERVVLQAVVEGEPTPSIRWHRNGIDCHTGPDLTVTNDGKTVSLMIHAMRSDLEGEYTCEATNMVGFAESSATVTLLELRRCDFHHSMSSLNRRSVSRESKSPYVRSLSQTNLTIRPRTPRADSVKREADTFQMTFSLPDDQAVVHHHHHHPAPVSPAVRQSAPVHAFMKPRFVKPLQNQTAIEGQELTFEVAVESDPPPTFHWYKDNQKIDRHQFPEYLLDTDHPMRSRLHIAEIFDNDAGKFTVTAQNAIGSEQTHAILFVNKSTTHLRPQAPIPAPISPRITHPTQQPYRPSPAPHTSGGNYMKPQSEQPVLPPGSPEFASKLPHAVLLMEGRTINLSNRLKPSDIPPQIVWFKNGMILNSSGRHRMNFNPQSGEISLNITMCLAEDEGEYRLVAKNHFGQVESTTYLLPEEKYHRMLRAGSMPQGTYGRRTSSCSTTSGDDQKRSLVNELEDRFKQKRQKRPSAPQSSYGPIRSFGGTDYSRRGTSVEKGIKPKFIRHPTNQDAVEGSAIRLECSVRGQPNPEVLWYRGINTIMNSDKHKLVVNEGGMHTLIINSLATMDAGEYTCVVRNASGEERSTVNLNVRPRRPNGPGRSASTEPVRFVQRLAPINAVVGATVTFSATFEGHPSPRILWQKNNKVIRPDGLHVQCEQHGSSLNLILFNVQPEDSAIYRCCALTEAGQDTTQAELNVTQPGHLHRDRNHVIHNQFPDHLPQNSDSMPVYHPSNVHQVNNSQSIYSANQYGRHYGDFNHEQVPVDEHEEDVVDEYQPNIEKRLEIIKPLQHVSVKKGDKASLSVEFVSEINCDVFWFREDIPVAPSNDYQIYTEANESILIIPEVFPEDGGKFSVAISNSITTIRSEAQLVVLTDSPEDQDEESRQAFAPDTEAPYFLTSLSDQSVTVGEKVTLCCDISGHPDSIFWQRNGWRLSAAPNPRHRTVRQDHPEFTSCSLVLSGVLSEDQGVYECVAVNKIGRIVSALMLFVIKDRRGSLESSLLSIVEEESPKIVQHLKTTTAMEGDTACFQVEFQGRPEPEIVWFKNSEPIGDNIKFEFLSEENCFKLQIPDISLADSGIYSVLVVNALGQAKSSARLVVLTNQFKGDLKSSRQITQNDKNEDKVKNSNNQNGMTSKELNSIPSSKVKTIMENNRSMNNKTADMELLYLDFLLQYISMLSMFCISVGMRSFGASNFAA